MVDVAALQFFGPSTLVLSLTSNNLRLNVIFLLFWIFCLQQFPYIHPPLWYITHCFSGDLGTLSLGIPYFYAWNATKVARYIYCSKWYFLQTIYIYIYDSGIVLNIVIPPLVTSCKILIIILNFLAALAVGRDVISDSAVAPLKFHFWGFPTVSGVCGVAFSKQCGKRFLLFCFNKPYCCSSQNPTIQTDTFKTWMPK